MPNRHTLNTLALVALALCIAFPVSAQYHSADTGKDYAINLSELLRVIQFFNSNGFHCETGTEDGYAPGQGDHFCAAHTSDYAPQNWAINLSELLRVIQFFNSSGYHTKCDSEDTFAPGCGLHSSCGDEGEGEGSVEQCTLIYLAGPSGSISGKTPQTLARGGSGTAVTAIPDPGYHFVQWCDGTTDNPRTDANVTGDISVIASFAAGGIVYVASGGTGDGSSWESPLGSIQDGVDSAAANGEVWVGAGTYTATTDPVVTLKSGIAVYGGFAGGELGRDARNWATNITSIDGQNARRCVIGADSAALDGFTFAHGSAIYDRGGGMLNDRMAPTVSNCTFTANSANYGGGMCNEYASPTVNNCTFTANASGFYGGGMCNVYASPTVNNCTFTANSAGDAGGGMCNEGGSPMVVDCTFTANSASTGAGMYNYDASSWVTNCMFTANTAVSGGGMYSRGSPTVINCTFTANSATMYGGGMVNSSSPTVINCTVTANTAVSGGGMYNFKASPTVLNCILWGDSSEIDNDATSSVSVTYSCVQGGYSGASNIDLDPLFVNPAAGDVQLLAGSPCVGAGTEAGAPDTDILGHLRPIGTGEVTMGAYEETLDATTPVHLTIAVSPWDCGATTIPAVGIYQVAPGSCIGISAPPIRSMHCVNWISSISGIIGTGPNATVLMGSSDETVTANFAINQYTLTYSAGEHGSISGDSQQTVDYGGSGTAVIAVPELPYYFVQWSDGSTNNPRTDANVTGDINVTASFVLGPIVYVALGGTGDGSSWASPLGSIQDGVDAAAPNAEVWVAAGTYTETTDPVVTLKSGVAVYGGFAGREIERDSRNWTTNITTIDGQNVRRCVIGADNGTLDGFTIAHGYGHSDSGGGMYNPGSSPTVINCTFTANSGNSGGGMANSSGSPTVINCTFTLNAAAVFGGGMYNAGGSPTVRNCIFTANSAFTSDDSGNSGSGGGMSNIGSSPTVSNCTFTENSSVSGGGISNNLSSPTVSNCTFTENSAVKGGGMSNQFFSPTVINCTFTANSAALFGGGMFNLISEPTVVNGTFTANRASTSGGAMCNSESPSRVINCTFTANSAYQGAGMGNYYDTSPTVLNCIFWGDSSEFYDYSCSPAVTYSCIQGGYPGAGNIDSDPLFVGAPDDLRLHDGSPCIDHGMSTGAPTTDILGVTRPQGAGFDMGAYER